MNPRKPEIGNQERFKPIFEKYFGLTVFDDSVRFELLLRKSNPDKFDRILSDLKKKLPYHENGVYANNRIYIDENELIQLQYMVPKEVGEKIQRDSHFYYPLCSLQEILRIECPKNQSDLLLKMRADAIADDPRMTRSFISRYEKNKTDWTLSKYFDDELFQEFISKLPEDKATSCKNVEAGFAMLRDPNGICMSSNFGPLILVSEMLRPYLFFMHIFYSLDTPIKMRFNSLVIAIRTMYQSESLDFDLDPRGEIPPTLESAIHNSIRWQLIFIIGHEYSHYILGHLDEARKSTLDHRIMKMRSGPENEYKYYNPREKQEFEADFGSISIPNYDSNQLKNVVEGAIQFFLFLDIFEAVSDYLCLDALKIKTHPKPIDRLLAIHKKYGPVVNIYTDTEMTALVEDNFKLKNILATEFLPCHLDLVEFYGSVYLDSTPRSRVDRLDY